MIEKCAQTIEDAIIPALADESVVLLARYTAAILHMLAPGVEEKSKELIQENLAMREVLGKARDALVRKSTSSNQVWTQLVESLDLDLQNKVHTDVLEENHRLKAALAQTIKVIGALTNDVPQETSASLSEQIRHVLRQQIDHGLVCLSGFQLKQIKV
jgi:thymidylate kinase